MYGATRVMGIPIPIRHANHSRFPFLLHSYVCSKQAFLRWKAKHLFSPIGILAAGGVMGCVKSGSQKSLVAGGVSAALLCHVYTQLPERPLYASSLGLGVLPWLFCSTPAISIFFPPSPYAYLTCLFYLSGTSVTLLAVMGSRNK